MSFNIKLTNTLETKNQEQNLPKNEQMVYMSGRSLHPISINLAAHLQEEFQGASISRFPPALTMTTLPRSSPVI